MRNEPPWAGICQRTVKKRGKSHERVEFGSDILAGLHSDLGARPTQRGVHDVGEGTPVPINDRTACSLILYRPEAF
jgi:hypothetical protein